MQDWIKNHLLLVEIVGFVYLQVVNAMPMPKDDQTTYKFIFTVLHSLTNWSRVTALFQGKAVSQ
jgi:hypothetical protein